MGVNDGGGNLVDAQDDDPSTSRKCERCGCDFYDSEETHESTDDCLEYLKFTERELDAEIEWLREVMGAVASVPGRSWLIGQLALAEALMSGDGVHLDSVMAGWREFKRAEQAAGGDDD